MARATRAERKRRDIKQQELAKLAGVSLGVVSNFERGRTRPQPGNLRAILEALGMEEHEEPTIEDDDLRREWPRDVAVFLDMMGMFLASISDAERAQVIHDLTRQVMRRRTP